MPPQHQCFMLIDIKLLKDGQHMIKIEISVSAITGSSYCRLINKEFSE
jgi:hypothetical protein